MRVPRQTVVLVQVLSRKWNKNAVAVLQVFMLNTQSTSLIFDVDRQYWFINKRPVDLPKFSRVINEVYRSDLLSCHGVPCCFVDGVVDCEGNSIITAHILCTFWIWYAPCSLQSSSAFIDAAELLMLQVLSPGSFDVNVTPNKRTIFVHEEKEILNAIKVLALGPFIAVSVFESDVYVSVGIF